MKPTIFEDPCPQPGQGVQDWFDRKERELKQQKLWDYIRSLF